MPRIMIDCPITKWPVFTGLVAPDVSKITEHTVQCPHCHRMHAFSARVAYLEKS
jgi:hypothetical protein